MRMGNDGGMRGGFIGFLVCFPSLSVCTGFPLCRLAKVGVVRFFQHSCLFKLLFLFPSTILFLMFSTS